jgi:DNA polymerase-1
MINTHKEFLKQKIRSKMILQVHDELVFDVFEDELERVKNIVKDKMEHAVTLSVPLLVETGVGSNWLEAH